MKNKKPVYFSVWYDNDEGMVCVAFSEKKTKNPLEGWRSKDWYFTSDEAVLLKDAQKQFIDAGFIKNKEFDLEIDQKIDNEKSDVND
jgi:hypothetical protein